MNYCLWCDQTFFPSITWHEVFLLEKEKKICRKCLQSLHTISGEICRFCGRSFAKISHHYRQGDKCYDCERWEKDALLKGVLTKNRSLYMYDEFLKGMINRFKFHGDAEVIKGIQHEWKELYSKEFKGMKVIPVPLSEPRLYERGFNQAFLLAELLEEPIYHFLVRKRHEKKQSKKMRLERLAVRIDTFQLNKKSHSLEGESFVLIDDIYTTGATLRQAALPLYRAGARCITSMTLARG